MSQDITIAVENQLVDILSERPDLFVVQVKTDVKNNIRVYLDGDLGVSIDVCAGTNRKLYRFIEESGLVSNGDFSLEVSSPGLDEPLRLPRQYTKNIGRQLEIILLDDREVTGELKAFNGDIISLEEKKGKGKKLELVPHELPLTQVKTAKVIVSF